MYFECPDQIEASQVLPILLVPESQQAYFYLFKDNHIYNFDCKDTFVQEIIETGCIMEISGEQRGVSSEGDLLEGKPACQPSVKKQL
jgi:hypothetical protein